MNVVHYPRQRFRPIASRLRGVLRLLLGTTLLAGLCMLLADPQAPGRWLGALIATL
jgi:hypothetical protein